MSSESREGIRRCEHALELSPFDPRLHMLYVNLSISCYWVGAFDESLQAGLKSVHIKQDNAWGWLCVLIGCLHADDIATATDAAVHVKNQSDWTLDSLTQLLFRPDNQTQPEKKNRARETIALLTELGF